MFSRPLKAPLRTGIRFASTSSKPAKSSFTPGSVAAVAAVLGIGLYSLDARSAINEYVWCPLLRWTTTAEQGHRLGINLLKYGLFPRAFGDHDDASLEVNVFGKTLANPIVMAAGFDKQGEAMDPLFDLGFGGVEIGTMTPEPQFGNPRPRFFRLSADEAVINRYGINSDGHLKILSRLRVRYEKFKGKGDTNAFHPNKMLLVNVGKNWHGDEIKDYLVGIQRFAPYADALVLNVSCPSAPGMRDLQAKAVLTELLTAAKKQRDENAPPQLLDASRKPPILVKVAPDLSEEQIKGVAQAAIDSKIDGIIMSNTTVERPASLITKGSVVGERGGLSGAPLKPISLKAFRILRKYTKDSDLILIGCGGITTGKDAIEYAKAGATFIELYSSFAYKGPGLAGKIKAQITEELKKEGKTWMEIVGEDDK